MNTLKLLVLTLILGLLVPTAAAAPLAGPCVPGATYDPACDVNQDGTVNVLDIQLAAGHWNQNGNWTSDNNHDHLGQTWIGIPLINNRLSIEGYFASPDQAALVLSNSAPVGNGLRVASAGGDGVQVNYTQDDGISVGVVADNGLSVGAAGGDGVHICATGSHVNCTPSTTNNGLEVGNAQDYGVRVNQAGADGVAVFSAGGDGVDVVAAAGNGVEAAGSNYAGYFEGNIFVAGSCTGCRLAAFAINAGDRPLQPGDVVSVQAVTPTDFDTGPTLWQVTPAQSGTAVVGVVAGRAELVTEKEYRPTETGKRLVPRDGAAQPGEYVTIVYSGPMQVKVASSESAITAGTRLTAAAGGRVRPLQTRTVDGMVVTEGTPVIGTALEPLAGGEGMIWVLVNPQ